MTLSQRRNALPPSPRCFVRMWGVFIIYLTMTVYVGTVRSSASPLNTRSLSDVPTCADIVRQESSAPPADECSILLAPMKIAEKDAVLPIPLLTVTGNATETTASMPLNVPAAPTTGLLFEPNGVVIGKLQQGWSVVGLLIDSRINSRVEISVLEGDVQAFLVAVPVPALNETSVSLSRCGANDDSAMQFHSLFISLKIPSPNTKPPPSSSRNLHADPTDSLSVAYAADEDSVDFRTLTAPYPPDACSLPNFLPADQSRGHVLYVLKLFNSSPTKVAKTIVSVVGSSIPSATDPFAISRFPCPGRCETSGKCVAEDCSCLNNAVGETCSDSFVSLMDGEKSKLSIAPGHWGYISVQLPKTLIVQMDTQLEVLSDDILALSRPYDLFIGQLNEFPTFQKNFKIQHVLKKKHYIGLIFRQLRQTDTTVWLGVYNPPVSDKDPSNVGVLSIEISVFFQTAGFLDIARVALLFSGMIIIMMVCMCVIRTIRARMLHRYFGEDSGLNDGGLDVALGSIFLRNAARERNPASASASRGLRDADFNGLSTLKFSAVVQDDQAPTDVTPGEAPCCSICLCEFEHEDEVRQLACGHYHHRECVDQWLRQDSSCPLCRRHAVTGQTMPEAGNRPLQPSSIPSYPANSNQNDMEDDILFNLGHHGGRGRVSISDEVSIALQIEILQRFAREYEAARHRRMMGQIETESARNSIRSNTNPASASRGRRIMRAFPGNHRYGGESERGSSENGGNNSSSNSIVDNSNTDSNIMDINNSNEPAFHIIDVNDPELSDHAQPSGPLFGRVLPRRVYESVSSSDYSRLDNQEEENIVNGH